MRIPCFVAACLLVFASSAMAQSVTDYTFQISMDGVQMDAPFTQVAGLHMEQEIIEYQDGDDPLTRKRPGRVKYGLIKFVRAWSAESTLNDWLESARVGIGQYERRNISIILSAGTPSQEIKRWNLFECFPESWKLAPLVTDGQTTLTEELVVACEWFEEA